MSEDIGFPKEEAPNDLIKKIQDSYNQSNNDLKTQVSAFVNAVSPYLSVGELSESAHYLTSEDTLNALKVYTFYRLRGCMVEDIDDIASYLNDKMETLFTAIYPLNKSILYGVASQNGRANIVIGIERDDGTTSSVISGLLTGIELEKAPASLQWTMGCAAQGGFMSAIPVTKVDDKKQHFDISGIMKSLMGKDYIVLFCAKPIPQEPIQQKFQSILAARDVCVGVSKRNVSLQQSVNDTKTETTSATRKGIIQELLTQATHIKSFDWNAIGGAILNGGNTSNSVSDAKTIEALAATAAFEMQNGIALEMVDYCDKAVERFRQGQNTGLWGVAVTYSAADDASRKVLESCLTGEFAKPSPDLLPIKKCSYTTARKNNKCSRIYLLNMDADNSLLAPLTSAELGMICTPPSSAVPDFEIRRGKVYPMIPSDGSVVVGHVVMSGVEEEGETTVESTHPFGLTEDDLKKHTFICGITGSGKTTTVKTILRNCDKPFLVIESAKKEYRSLALADKAQSLKVYTLGRPEYNCPEINPFFVQQGISLQTHIDFLKDLFNASFSFYGPMPYILEKCLQNIYRKRGWNLTLGYHPYFLGLNKKRLGADTLDAADIRSRYACKASKYLFPTMEDLKGEVKRYIEQEMTYEGEVAGNIKSAMLARLESLCSGSKGYMFNTRGRLDMSTLLNERAVFELEGLADDADKAFCVGLLVVFINEYRQSMTPNGQLNHLLVIEEAHRLLKNVETERTSENMGNPKGKAVEHFTNMIAEMRSYGQGVIIAEQIPSKLAPDVIKNTSNKIVQRVVSADDQAIIANTIGMKQEDGIYLGTLKSGYALCHKEGMSLPVLVKVHRESDKNSVEPDVNNSFGKIDEQIVRDALHGKQDEYAVKLLNSILSQDASGVTKSIERAEALMERDMVLAEAELLQPTNNVAVYDTILKDAVLALLSHGVYSKGMMVPNNVVDAVDNLFSQKSPKAIRKVKDALHRELYAKEPENQCKQILSALVIRAYTDNMDIEGTLRLYFYYPQNEFIRSVANDIRKKVQG